MRFANLEELLPRLEKLGEPEVRKMLKKGEFEAHDEEEVRKWLACEVEEQESLVRRAAVQELLARQIAEDANKIKDIKHERGCRRIIRDYWLDIRNLYGKDADGHQVLRVLNRKMEKDKTKPSLKTVQNCLIELRKEKLIP